MYMLVFIYSITIYENGKQKFKNVLIIYLHLIISSLCLLMRHAEKNSDREFSSALEFLVQGWYVFRCSRAIVVK